MTMGTLIGWVVRGMMTKSAAARTITEAEFNAEWEEMMLPDKPCYAIFGGFQGVGNRADLARVRGDVQRDESNRLPVPVLPEPLRGDQLPPGIFGTSAGAPALCGGRRPGGADYL